MKSLPRWQHYSKLLDEALDLAPAEQAQWLAALALTDADAASALTRLLGRSPPVPAQVSEAMAAGLALAPSPAATQAGQSYGPWQVHSKLGEGGMGEVWLAHRADQLFEGKAAIKLLRERGDAERFEARFARERKALARLNHPGIARLLDAGVAEHQAYLVLEYVEGQLLTDYAQAQALNLAACLRLLLQVALAVDYAHGRFIVHRDLKPSNIIVTASGSAKLLDFGIAGLLDDASTSQSTALTQLHGRGLTLDYAAPEQIRGEATSVASDVYSLGVLLFELVSGERPFVGLSRAALEHAVVHLEAPRLGRTLAKLGSAHRPADAQRARGDVEAIVAKCLRKKPDDRYQSVAALIADLQNWLERRPVSAGREDWRYRSRLWLLRNWLPVGLATATFLALLGGLVTSLVLYGRASSAQHKAEKAATESDAVRQFLAQDLLAGIDPGKQPTKDLRMADVLAHAAQQVEGRLAGQPRAKALVYGALADSYQSLQRLNEAITYLDKASALAQQFSAEFAAKDRLYFLERKAGALWQSSRLQEALAAYLQVEQGWRSELGTGLSAEVLRPLMVRASILTDLGRYTEAGDLLRSAQATALQLRPPDTELASYAEFAQSQAHIALGQYPQALALLLRCVAYAQQKDGSSSFAAARTQGYLGEAYLRMGQLGFASATLKAAEASLAQQLGEQDPQLDLINIWLGELMLATDKPQEALTQLQTAKARVLKHYGPEDTTMLALAPPLVDALLQSGRARDAEQEAQQALAVSQKLLGGLHPRTLALQLALAQAQVATAQTVAAQSTLAAAAAGAMQLPAQHPLRQQWQKLNAR